MSISLLVSSTQPSGAMMATLWTRMCLMAMNQQLERSHARSLCPWSRLGLSQHLPGPVALTTREQEGIRWVKSSEDDRSSSNFNLHQAIFSESLLADQRESSSSNYRPKSLPPRQDAFLLSRNDDGPLCQSWRCCSRSEPCVPLMQAAY